MRILTTTMCYPTPDSPGQGVFVQRRAAGLARLHDVCVVSPRPWCPLLRTGGSWLPQPEPLPVTYPRMLSIPVIGWATDGAGFSLCLQQEVLRMRRGGQPPFDLIDAHFEYPDGVGAWLAGRKLGLPVVVTLRGKLPFLMGTRLRRAQVRAMLRGVDAVIAVSASLAELAGRLVGAPLRVDVIPNGVDTTVFHPVGRSAARDRLGWNSDARYVVCVGHYQRLKGFDRLVDAFPRVRAELGDVRLVLAGSRRGETGFQRRLAAMVLNSPASKAITCLEEINSAAVNLLFNAADVAVNASRSEGWCNAISEALAAGTPVVATDVGGNPEQIHGDELGLVVASADEKQLAEGIIAALTRRWDRARIAAHGGQRDWGRVAREVTAVFERVLGGEPNVERPASRRREPACSGGRL